MIQTCLSLYVTLVNSDLAEHRLGLWRTTNCSRRLSEGEPCHSRATFARDTQLFKIA